MGVLAGMALGMVMQLPDQDDETSVSRRQLLAKLDVCMGGRVAEELIFGESNITTGAPAVSAPAGHFLTVATHACNAYASTHLGSICCMVPQKPVGACMCLYVHAQLAREVFC